MLPLAGAGLVVGGIKATTGLIEAAQASKRLNELNKNPIDEYSISPELQNSYSRAEAMTNQGFSPEETANFNQGVARQQTGAFQSAVDMSGGNLSSAIGSVLKAQNIGSQNDFAAEGAKIRSNNIARADELSGRIQSQKNLMVEAKRQRRTMLEQAYGAAKQQGIENFTDGLTGGITAAASGASPAGASSLGTPDPNLYR